MDEESFKLFEAFDFGNNVSFQAGWRAIEKLIDPQKSNSELIRARAFFFTKNVRKFDLEHYLLWKKAQWNEAEEAGAVSDSSKETIGDNDAVVLSKDGCCESSQGEGEKHELLNRDVECDSNMNRLLHSTEAFHQYETDTVSCPLSLAQSSSVITNNSPILLVSFSENPVILLHENYSSAERTLFTSEKSDSVDQVKLSKPQTDLESHFSNNLADDSVTNKATSNQEDNLLSLADLAHLIQTNSPIPGVKLLDVKPTNCAPTPSVMSRKPKPWEALGKKETLLSSLVSGSSAGTQT